MSLLSAFAPELDNVRLAIGWSLEHNPRRARIILETCVVAPRIIAIDSFAAKAAKGVELANSALTGRLTAEGSVQSRGLNRLRAERECHRQDVYRRCS